MQTLPPFTRKLLLVAHVATSVGWLGAVCAYLGLAVAGRLTTDAEFAATAYQLVRFMAWYVVVPFALASVVVGLVQSLGTKWGLIGHYWVLAKFALSTVGTLILLQHLDAVDLMARLAAASALAQADQLQLRTSLVIHPAGGVLLLLTATVLSVYKPWGATPFAERAASTAPPAAITQSPVVAGARSRWGMIIGAHAVVVALLALAAHAAGLRH